MSDKHLPPPSSSSSPSSSPPPPSPSPPPDVSSSLFDARIRDLSSSTAFTLLSSLYERGKITAAQLDMYKGKYAKLHDMVVSTYELERCLLERAKLIKSEVESERIKLEQRTLISADTIADIEILQKEDKERKALLAQMLEEKASVHAELEDLQQQRSEARDQHEWKHKQALLAYEPRHALAVKLIEEMKAEIAQQQELYEKELQAQAEYVAKGEQLNQSLASLEKEKIKGRSNHQQALSEPERMKTNIAMIEKVLKEMEDECNKLSAEAQRYEQEISEINERRRKTNATMNEMNNKLENFRLAISKRKTLLDDVKRSREIEEQKKDLNAEKASHIAMELLEEKEKQRALTQQLNEYTKHIEQQKKLYEKQRRKKETIVSIQQPLREQIRESERSLLLHKEQHSQQRAMLVEIKQDEELFIAQYLAQEKLEEDTVSLLNQLEKDQREYEEKIKLLDKAEKELQLELSSLSAAREMTGREASRATALYRETKEALKIKNLILIDLDNQTSDSFAKLKSSAVKYEKMKNQRNKLANLTAASAQAIAEMKEKIKILANEVEILRNESNQKEKSLNDEARASQAGLNQRDQLRAEQNKYINTLRTKKDEQAQQQMEIIKLNSIISASEHQMINLRKDYAMAVDNRNLTGITLVDRNDELCILYEKQNIQKEIAGKGEEELRGIEEQIAVLNREINDFRRRIEVARGRIPSLDSYAATTRTLKLLEQQLAAERERTEELCRQLETPVGGTGEINRGMEGGKAGEESKLNENTPSSSANMLPPLPGRPSSGSSSPLSLFPPPLPSPSSSSLSSDRCRHLPGSDPEPDLLLSKIDLLSHKLTQKREQLLERELVLSELSSLSDKLRVQAAETRPQTLELGKRMNEAQAALRGLTRKLMAAVSELSMYQANCLKLEGEKKEAEERLAVSRERMKGGMAPSDTSEHEWARMERERVRKAEAMISGQRAREELWEKGENVVRTTAIPRPNAYIQEEMGLPMPYGGVLAPFKPGGPTGQLRHYKIPTVKDIQL